jgi:nucleoside phosphorylase
MAWQWLIRGWLAGAAKQELYARAEEMLREQLRRQQAGDGNAEQALPPPCDVGIVFPSAAEAAGVRDQLEDAIALQAHGFEVRLGRFAGRHVAVAQGSAAGSVAAAAQSLIRGHRPGVVMAAGFADALTARVGRGHVVLASAIAKETAGSCAEFVTALADASSGITKRPRTHVGRIVSVNILPGSKDERAALGERLGALALEQSAASVAEICQQQGVPFFAVYAIRRGLNQETSPELRHLRKQESLAGKLGAVLGAVTRRPSTVKEMLQSAEDTLTAGDRLAEVLDELVRLLPAQSP